MSKLPWKPWHEVVALREDLKSGELPLQMFAADLYELLMQRGEQPVYEKPESFFSLTFPMRAGKPNGVVRRPEMGPRVADRSLRGQ